MKLNKKMFCYTQKLWLNNRILKNLLPQKQVENYLITI